MSASGRARFSSNGQAWAGGIASSQAIWEFRWGTLRATSVRLEVE